MKQSIITLCAFFLLLGNPFTVNAKNITIVINGIEQTLSSASFKKNEVLYVPLRELSHPLNLQVNWSPELQVAVIKRKDTIVYVPASSKTVFINGSPALMKAETVFNNNTIYVPLRSFCAIIQANVSYDQANNQIYISLYDELENHDYELIKTKEKSTEEIVRLADPKVVLLKTEHGSASGVIVKNGIILTNAHVMKGLEHASVVLNDGSEYEIDGILGINEMKDVILLSSEGMAHISPVTIGSSNALKKGEKVIAISSPIGLQNTVSEGIVSGKRLYEKIPVIQTTATIFYGSSGGGLFNKEGKLVGITTGAYNDNVNLNYAIEIDPLKSWIESEVGN